MKTIRILNLSLIICLLGHSACNNRSKPTIYSEENTPIEYSIDGSGDNAVVFIHGWSCDKGYWDFQVPYFAKNYKVIAIDLPGHGESLYDREEWSMKAFGQDVAAIVEGLDLKQVVLVGHSMGGSVILEAASILGNRVKGLIGVDTFQDFESVFPEDQFKSFFQPFQDNFVETTKNFVRSMFPPTADSLLIESIASDMSPAPREVALGSFQGLFEFTPIPVLEQIKVPIFCINSDMYPVNIEAGKKYSTKFEIRFMKGYGHFLHQEDPDMFNKMLEEILEELFSD